jgi:hypothetical protein
MKINLYVENLVFYQHPNLQLEIPYIQGYAKMTNYEIYNSE